MRCLVLGATGMLGQALMAEGERRGFEMVGAARSGAQLDLDITDADALYQVIKKQIKPDVVINAAAIASVERCEQAPHAALALHVTAVAHLAKMSPCLVQISTDQTGDGMYARTKALGDSFAVDEGHLVVPTNIVGLRGHGEPTFLEWALGVIEGNLPAELYPDYFTSSIDVWHFAESLFDLIPSRPVGRLNLAARESVSKEIFIRTLAERLGKRLTRAKSVSGVKPMDLTLDVSAAEALLGYRLPTTDEVIDRIVEKLEDFKSDFFSKNKCNV